MTAIPVLLVDDSAAFRRLATRFLEERSAGEVTVVGTAAGSVEALAEAARLRPQIVLIDVSMPGGPSGLETLSDLRRILPDAGIVVLTVLDGPDYREASLAAGADEFVSKSQMYQDLLPAIRHVTGSARPPARGAASGG